MHAMAIRDALGVAAGRVADDVGRVGAGPAATCDGVRLEPLRIQAFGSEHAAQRERTAAEP